MYVLLSIEKLHQNNLQVLLQLSASVLCLAFFGHTNQFIIFLPWKSCACQMTENSNDLRNSSICAICLRWCGWLACSMAACEGPEDVVLIRHKFSILNSVKNTLQLALVEEVLLLIDVSDWSQFSTSQQVNINTNYHIVTTIRFIIERTWVFNNCQKHRGEQSA